MPRDVTTEAIKTSICTFRASEDGSFVLRGLIYGVNTAFPTTWIPGVRVRYFLLSSFS
jgi:hypothetical protein